MRLRTVEPSIEEERGVGHGSLTASFLMLVLSDGAVLGALATGFRFGWSRGPTCPYFETGHDSSLREPIAVPGRVIRRCARTLT